jgi:cytochrome c-type biogenesis protein CcmE
MRRHHKFAFYLAAALAVITVCAVYAAEDQEVKKVTIDKLAKSPGKYQGHAIAVKGIVAEVSIEKKMFTIMDDGTCGGCPSKAACGKIEIPVLYKGKLPKKKSKVTVTGQLVQPEMGRFVLKAVRVE